MIVSRGERMVGPGQEAFSTILSMSFEEAFCAVLNMSVVTC
jgi:hypothetical protein